MAGGLDKVGLALLHRMDPEVAHSVALRALQSGLGPRPGPITSARLKTTLAGMDLPNPIGMAAGLDKNAVALTPLAVAGFGFLEVGATTPRPQAGNPKPRLFRLPEDRAVINRFGFNNEGMAAMAARLKERPANAVVGLNLGANKDSADRAADFAQVLETCGPMLDFATVNVSSPNTENLRDLQGKAALMALLQGVLKVRDGLDRRIPIFVKIAPDLSDGEIAEIAEVAAVVAVDGIVATNTTLSREGLRGAHAAQAGGLSGAPLMERSTAVLARLYTETAGAIPLIGVGGVASGADAYAKIRAGATAVQLYTALVYGGVGLVEAIVRELDELLARDGVARVADAVGLGVQRPAG